MIVALKTWQMEGLQLQALVRSCGGAGCGGAGRGDDGLASELL